MSAYTPFLQTLPQVSTVVPRVGSLVLVACFILTACATPPGPRLPEGPIAIVPVRFQPEAAFNIYAKGKGHAAGALGTQGAGEGALAGTLVPVGMGPVGIAAYPVIAPFTILAGAIIGGGIGASYGLMHGLPADQATTVSHIVDDAISQLDIQQGIARRIQQRSLPYTQETTLLLDRGPQDRKDQPDYSEQRPSQFNGVLETAILAAGMAAKKGDPPRVALEMKLRIRIVTLNDTGVSGERVFDYASRPHPLSAWSASGGQLLAEEFELANESLAQYVAEIYFLPLHSSRLQPVPP